MNSSLIDVAIGLFLVYFVFSTACTVLTEWWSRLNTARPRHLQRFLGEMLGSSQWSENTFYKHPLMEALRTERLRLGSGTTQMRLPSYIPEKVFALTLIDLAFLEQSAHHLEIAGGIPERLKTTLHALTNCTRNSCQHTQDRLERWFSDSMGRLSGRYRRYAQTVVLIAAATITVSMNVDTVLLARNFSLFPARAQAAVTMATRVDHAIGWQRAGSDEPASAAFRKVDLPLGWPDPAWPPANGNYFFYALGKAAGWILSIFALSLGAPFWFDTLGRIVNLRQAGPQTGGK